MKTRSILIAVAAWALLAPRIALAQPLADRIPADALVYVAWTGGDSMPPAFAGSHLKAVLDASNAGDLVGKLLPQLIDKIAEQQHGDAAMVRDAAAVYSAVWKYPTAFYFGGLEFPAPGGPGGEPQPRLAFLCKAGGETAALKTRLENALKQAPPSPVKISVQASADTLFLLIGDLPQTALKRLGAPFEEEQKVAPATALSDDANFKSALTKGHKDAVFIAYANVAGILKMVNDGVDKFGPDEAKTSWPKVRDALGLSGVKQVISSCGFEGKDWGSRLFIDAPAPRKGIFALFDAPPGGAAAVSDKALELIPRTATMATAGRFSLDGLLPLIRTVANDIEPKAGEQLDQALKQASDMIGLDVQKDLLGALGDEWVSYTDKSIGGNGFLGVVMVNRLKDGPAGEKAFSQLEKVLGAMIGESIHTRDIQIKFKTTSIPRAGGDQVIHYLAVPLVAPAWTIHDGNLYLALYPQVLASAVDRPKDSILQNPQFVQLRQSLGAQKATSISFVDLPQTAGDGYQTMLLVTRLLTGAADMFGLDAPAITPAPLHKILPHLSPAGGAFIADETGWYFRNIEPFPGSSLLSGQMEGMVGVQTAAFMTGILVPALGAAKQAANTMKSATQVRGIVSAATLWSAANSTDDSFPPDLGSLVVDKGIDPLHPKLLLHPDSRVQVPSDFDRWDDAKKKEWVNANSSYVYLGNTQKNLTNAQAIIVYEKPEFAHKGMISVGYGDVHVEAVPVREVLAQVAKQQGGKAPGDSQPKTPPTPR